MLLKRMNVFHVIVIKKEQFVENKQCLMDNVNKEFKNVKKNYENKK